MVGRLRGITGTLLAAALAACAVAPVERAGSGVAADIAMTRNGSAWEVRYTLPRPARALRFARVDHQGTRARDWTPLEPQFELVSTPDGEVVRRRDGAAFIHVGFAMQPLYVHLEKDYAPFSPFGDGGLLIHSGRLHTCAGQCEDDVAYRWRVRIGPPAGAHAILGGRVAAEADFIDRQPGTNVYVGRAQPLETPDVVAVIDAAMPAGIRDRLDALLPRLMELYAEEFGPLPSRPMLYASRDELHPGGGYGYQGGTLPEQVLMHVYGRSDAFATDELADRMDSFFAHEAAHLYQRYPTLGEQGDSWIHEGGAEAMALLALARLGEIDQAAVRRRVDEAASACASGIGKAPLLPLPPSGRFDLTYSCGLVVQMAIEGAARGMGDACDLFCVWREFQGRVDAGAPWTTATFVRVVADRVGPDTARFAHEAVTGSPEDPEAFLTAGLGH